MPSPTHSAIVVRAPAAEALVHDLRGELDPSAAWGVPAHVTVLYPFAPPAQITIETLSSLRNAIQTVSSFQTRLVRTCWFGSDVLWLQPEPDDGFRALTEALRLRFPEYAPYDGVHADVIPHLTVGQSAEHARMRRAERILMPDLPVDLSVSHAELWCGAPMARSWTRVDTFALGT